jgi:hypothetical protein
MILRVQIVHEEINQNGFQEIGIEPDIIEYLEDGYINLSHVVAVSAYHEHTQIFLSGSHSLIIDEDFDTFVSKWRKTQ